MLPAWSMPLPQNMGGSAAACVLWVSAHCEEVPRTPRTVQPHCPRAGSRVADELAVIFIRRSPLRDLQAHMLSALQPQLVKSYLSSVNRLKAQSECLQTLMGRVQLKFNIRYSLGHGHFPNTVLALNLFPEKAC